jgi:phosphomannomutase
VCSCAWNINFTLGAWPFAVRRSGTEQATRIYTEAPGGIVENVRRALGA